MNIGDIYNSVGSGIADFTKPISSFFQQPAPYVKKEKVVNPSKIPEAIRQLESSGGTHPMTPRNERRTYTVPAANKNEKPRTISYDIGYAGEYGLTPLAIAELAKSKVDKKAPVSAYTKYGPPVIQGMSPQEIQKQLMTVDGAGKLAHQYFLSKRQKQDYSPESLTEDYINNYVGKGTAGDTLKNRARVLNYFNSITN